MVVEKGPGTLKKLTRYLTEPFKFICENAFDLYSRAYEKHPISTTLLSLATLFAAETAIGAYIGKTIIGNITETVGTPGHYQPIYNSTQTGRVFVPIPPYWQPRFDDTVIGQKWVESTLKTQTYPLGENIGAAAGMLSVIPTALGLSHLSERFERKTNEKR